MKWLGIVVLAVLVGGGWFLFSQSDNRVEVLQSQIDLLVDEGDPESRVPRIESEIQSIESQKTFNGILLAFLTAGLIGVLFVVFVLPAWAQSMTQSVYDSGEEIERTSLHEARAFIAKGDYDGAIEAFRKAAIEDPSSRVPWLEISKIQNQQLGNWASAIETLEGAVSRQKWPEDDRAFFLFRLADLYEEEAQDREKAVATLRRVIAEIPDTRHAANARHKLGEWQMP